MAAKTPAQKREQEKQTVGLMIELYCHGHHGTRGHALCPDCEALRSYADARVDHCPHMETKTFCSACKTHCYKPQMREAIRQVMRWSGPRMIFHHPVLAIRHLIAATRKRPPHRGNLCCVIAQLAPILQKVFANAMANPCIIWYYNKLKTCSASVYNC